MVRRTTWILLIVFGVLVLFALLFQRYQSNKAGSASTATVTPAVTADKLYNVPESQVVEINIVSSSGESIDFTRDPGATTWVIKGVPADQANSLQIESAGSQLLSLTPIDTLTQSTALASVGLVNPAFTITLVTADGEKIVTYIGSLSAIGTGYYIRIDSGPVVLVDNVTMDDILNLLKEPPVLVTATPEGTGTEAGTPAATTATYTTATEAATSVVTVSPTVTAILTGTPIAPSTQRPSTP